MLNTSLDLRKRLRYLSFENDGIWETVNAYLSIYNRLIVTYWLSNYFYIKISQTPLD